MYKILSTALLLSCALAGGAATAQAPGGAPPRVTVAAAVTQEIVESASFVGRAEAVDAVDLVARVTGFLREIVVADGAQVAAGDVLFRIEPDAYEAALSARQADLARAEANLRLAEVELDRTRQLVERQASPESELDVKRADRAVAEAEIAAAEAAIRQARLDLSYTEIAAPFDGRIGRVAASVGDLVGPTTGALAALVRERPIYVAFSLSEREATTFAQAAIEAGTTTEATVKGMPVSLTLPNGSPLDETGAIAFAENRIDPTTGTLAVRAEFANTQRLIVDGSFLTVRVAGAEPVQRLVVPQAAVQRDQRGDFVLVVGPQQTVEQRYVTTAQTVAADIVVTDGLQPGESVIVEGLQRVRPGVPVEAVLAGAAASEAAASPTATEAGN